MTSSSFVQGRKDSLQKQEWYDLAIQMSQATDRHLPSDSIIHLNQLSHPEKCDVLKRIARNLKSAVVRSTVSNDDFNETISELLENSIDNNDDSQPFLTRFPSQTKSSTILNQISNDITDLFDQWPDRKYTLHAIFNNPFPQPLRLMCWYRYLSNANYRQKFLTDLIHHPQSVLSPMDSEIHSKCKSLLSTLPVASAMINNKGNMLAMEAILSYYRSLFFDSHKLSDTEYYSVIPIILAHQPFLSRSEELDKKSLTVLVEMYRTWLDIMSSIFNQAFLNNSAQDFEPWFRKVEYHMKNIDPPVYNHLQTIFHTHRSRTTTDSSVLVPIRTCCHRWFKYMFVDCLPTDPLLFVWDQYLITSDIPNFHNELLPAIATAVIIILKDLLLNCNKISEIEAVLQHRTVNIATDQLQSIITQFFLPDLKTSVVRSHSCHQTEASHLKNSQPLQVNRKASPLYNLLRRVAETCNRVAHGDEESRVKLDDQTKAHIRTHKFDLKMAEREVIGRILSVDEWNALSSKQKHTYDQQKLNLMYKRIQHRYITEQRRLLDEN